MPAPPPHTHPGVSGILPVSPSQFGSKLPLTIFIADVLNPVYVKF